MTATPIGYNERRRRTQLRILVLPAALWLIIFFAIPLGVVVLYSFLSPSISFAAALPLTFNNYTRALGPAFISTLVRSVGVAVLTTVICLLAGYPMAYFIATRSPRTRNLFLMLVIVPFWTNFLVRTYAIGFVITDNGLINSILVNYLHLTEDPLHLMFTPFAVILGLVYGYLPFMVLPVYTAIEKFNFRLVEAAHDLGANDPRAFFRVMFPVTLPGVLAGCILVFIPALGAYVTPTVLGGSNFLMIGPQITEVATSATGKPFGSSLSIVMMFVVVLALLAYYRYGDGESTGII